MQKKQVSRRYFFLGSLATVTAASTVGSMVTGSAVAAVPFRGRYRSLNEKLNMAAIGAGGKGSSDIGACAQTENVVALCDVDWKQGKRGFDRFPNAKKYKDFREMLDKEKIDAVTISTPDHMHACVALWAMERGIHVYVQKPLARTIYELNRLLEASRKYKVATMMGNQGHSEEGVRHLCEMVWAGFIGEVKEVHAWTNRPIWPQGIANPLPKEPIPDTMDWDKWLGTAAMRDYNSKYAPFNWRAWFDFGCGALGDMACHILDPANWALQLSSASQINVECVKQEGKNKHTYPTKSVVRFDFSARGAMPPVSLYWYDGGILPPRPPGLKEDVKLGEGDNGSNFIGSKGVITTGTYGGDSRLLPLELNKEMGKPTRLLSRTPGPGNCYLDWIRACKGGEPGCANFEYSVPFTEWVNLGIIALRVDGKLAWDNVKKRFTNSAEANKLLKPYIRKGWKV